MGQLDPTQGVRGRPIVALVGWPQETNVELAAAWHERGVPAGLLNPSESLAFLDRGDVAVARVDVLPTLDGVEPGLDVLDELEQRGVRVINSRDALLNAHDKLRTSACLFQRRLRGTASSVGVRRSWRGASGSTSTKRPRRRRLGRESDKRPHCDPGRPGVGRFRRARARRARRRRRAPRACGAARAAPARTCYQGLSPATTPIRTFPRQLYGHARMAGKKCRATLTAWA